MNSLPLAFNSMAASIGVAMHNASTNQHNSQLISSASLAICCKLVLRAAKPKKK